MAEDTELAEAVRKAARQLAAAMNEAGRAGLDIELEMRPHNRDDFADGSHKLYGYVPMLKITRTVVTP